LLDCGPSIQRRPQPGDIVLAMYGAGGGGDFYRARVVVSTPEGVQVDFIDYGDSELVSYKNIYEINEDLFSVMSLYLIICIRTLSLF